ncbi:MULTISPECIES: WxL domain-containing protein [unclassified Enterococcus]|uniref:WxL domain-containing protein n=1 Tax=unclassified Enterococcus TaxID=2608891 RepID=UPI003F23B6EA
MNFRKQALVCTTLLLLAHVIPLGITRGYAETNESIDEQTLTDFRSHIPDYVAMSTAVAPVKEAPPVVQEFSFVEKTFQTVTNQPVILRFTSTYPADEVLVRVPREGQVLANHFSDGESITHSHGEYWTLHTKERQTEFTLPVVFATPGNYFLTVDHDADHFYLEVEESTLKSEDQKSSDLKDQENTGLEEQPSESQDVEVMKDIPVAVQSVVAAEKNLSIPEELIQTETNRILEASVDPQRNTATPSNWSQFRSAWNDQRTVSIVITQSISYSSSILGSSLNTRNTSVNIIGRPATQAHAVLSMFGSNNNLELSGAATLTLNGLSLMGANSANTNDPIIKHNGSGLVEINNILASYNSNPSIIHAQNINLRGYFELNSPWGGPAISLVRSGTLTITPAPDRRSNISSRSAVANNRIKPIESDSSSRIIINANRLTMAMNVSTPKSSWHSVNATLTGVNGSQVLTSESDPNDFEERYTQLFGESWYSTLIFNGSGSSWVTPPRPSYVLSLEASPTVGGMPMAETTTIIQGETTMIHANPAERFDFLRWEIVSGTGSRILNPTNATTTFTMGTTDTVVQAVYQKKQGGDITVEYVDNALKELSETEIISGLIDEEYETEAKEIDGYTLTEVPKNASGRFTEEAQTVTYVYTKDILDPVLPVDPLAPEKEVDPENPPELPEDQGTLSIDFASRFSFGTQGISAQTKRYYAQPQHLLNADGSINDAEERPNYIQVSDRRPEEERHGWQLAVTQNNQFTDRQDNQLRGARLLLNNQQFASVQESNEPMLQNQDGIVLIPEEKTLLVTAHDGQGAGTWIYRFGNRESAGESVALEVPPTANPRTATYQTTLTWELSAVPDN